MLWMLMTGVFVCAGSLTLALWLSSAALAQTDSGGRHDDFRGSAEGVWVGNFDFSGTSRAFTFQLEERDDHRLLGYVLGGTISRTIVEGRRIGAEVTFAVELRDPVRTKVMTISGHVLGDTLTGTAGDGIFSQPVVLRRARRELHERTFFLAEADFTGEFASFVQLAVVLDSRGGFVSGGFVGDKGCRMWACSGGITSFEESGAELTIGIETDGGCSAGSSVHGVFDAAAKTYSATYSFTDCQGTTTGSLLVARSTRTRSDDVARILQALGELADDFEGRPDFRASHRSFSRTYLHYGRTLRDTLAGFNEERRRFLSIDAAFNRIQVINTVEDPDVLPILQQPLGAYFDEVRQGRPARGAAPVTYVDSHATPGDRTMRVWSREGSRWVMLGNQAAALDLPFEYTLGTTSLITPTPGGPVYVAMGPYGAHFSPLTGHQGGDPKGNLVGFLTQSNADLTELSGDGDGLCEPTELCGFFGGDDGSLVRNHIPLYTAPLPATIHSVIFRAPNGVYFDNVPKWVVEIRLYQGQHLSLDHVGWIAPGLRDKILAATGGMIDTDTYVGPEGEIAGVAGIPVAAGEALAFPQMLATPIPGHPGYFSGGGTFLERPWAEMQFSLSERLPGTVDRVCIYDHLSPALKGTLQSILDADTADPASQMFSGFPRRWEWSAETRLCRAYSTLPQDFSSLYGNFGGWFRVKLGPEDTAPSEMVAFVEIEKDTASYDPALYSLLDVTTLITRVHPADYPLPFRFVVPGSPPVVVDAFDPAGEILELTGNSLSVKWRSATFIDITLYERASYILDEKGLKVRWGPFALTAEAAITPVPVTVDTPCNTFNVVCYDRTHRSGF
jgi:hypothetical protein